MKLRSRNKELRNNIQMLIAEKDMLIKTIKENAERQSENCPCNNKERCCLAYHNVAASVPSSIAAELHDQAVPMALSNFSMENGLPTSNIIHFVQSESESNDSFLNSTRRNRATTSTADIDSDSDSGSYMIISMSESEDDSEDAEDTAIDLTTRKNLPLTVSLDSDDSNQPTSSQESSSTFYDSGYPSSSLESDVPMSSQESQASTSSCTT